MKGLFIPGITAKTLRNVCLEAVEALIAEGEFYDIEYEPGEQKKGEWEQKFSPAYKGGGYIECSNCKYKFSIGVYFEAESWKYCPECWARMKGDEIDC